MKGPYVLIPLVSVLLVAGTVWAKGSTSMATASDGWLIHAATLPPASSYHRILKTTRNRGHVHGTDELIAAIKRAAMTVFRRRGGIPLVVGNLSRLRGGDIASSVSHNSGRDVDIAFYMVRTSGVPVVPARYYHFDSQGRSGSFRFDTVRNWELVRSLLTDPNIQVQHIFLYAPLRTLLIEYARASDDAPWLVARAEEVMRQPRHSSPHSDHFHIRLYCTRDDRLSGCLNTGPTWEWIDNYTRDVDRLSLRLASDFHDTDTAVAIASIQEVGRIRGGSAVAALGRALRDSRFSVREAASQAISVMDNASFVVPELIRQVRQSKDPRWTLSVVRALAKIRDVASAPLLLTVLSSTADISDETRTAAAHGLGGMVYLPAIPHLISSLLEDARPLREASATALHRITNHDFGSSRASHARWVRWWNKNQLKSRMDWVEASFSRRGIRLSSSRGHYVARRLLYCIRKGGADGFNARAWIQHATGFYLERQHYNDLQLFRLYQSRFRLRGFEAANET